MRIDAGINPMNWKEVIIDEAAGKHIHGKTPIF